MIRVIKHSHNKDYSTLYRYGIHQSDSLLPSNQHPRFHYETRSKQDGGGGQFLGEKRFDSKQISNLKRKVSARIWPQFTGNFLGLPTIFRL